MKALRATGGTARLTAGVLAAIVSFGMCSGAKGATVTIGNPLLPTGSTSSGCGKLGPCTFVALAFPNKSVGLVQSPVNGAIVKWRIKGANTLPGYAIRILRRESGLEFTGAGTSAPATPTNSDLVQEFNAALPIQAGDYLGLDVPVEGRIGLNAAPGASFGFFSPMISDGESKTTGQFFYEVAFNADVQPAPAITSLSPSSGPITGGTAVTINGFDFTGVTGVKFGDSPASSFAVNSEEELIAISPPVPSPQVVQVEVTTIAGTSAVKGGGFFEYLPLPPPSPLAPAKCIVPKLTGKTLKAARRRIRKSVCKIGRVRKLEGATSKTGRIVKQKPKAGRTVSAGRAVTLTLG